MALQGKIKKKMNPNGSWTHRVSCDSWSLVKSQTRRETRQQTRLGVSYVLKTAANLVAYRNARITMHKGKSERIDNLIFQY
jgi:YD repeat-containing protein